MDQKRLELLIDIYKEAKSYNSLENVYEVNAEQYKQHNFNYEYLQSAGLIRYEEISDAEKYEIVLTAKGVDKVEQYLAKKATKSEDEEFNERLDLLWESINNQFLSEYEINEKFLAFLSRTTGFAHVKGNAFLKMTDMIMRAYKEGLGDDSDIHETVGGLLNTSKETGDIIGETLKNLNLMLNVDNLEKLNEETRVMMGESLKKLNETIGKL